MLSTDSDRRVQGVHWNYIDLISDLEKRVRKWNIIRYAVVGEPNVENVGIGIVENPKSRKRIFVRETQRENVSTRGPRNDFIEVVLILTINLKFIQQILFLNLKKFFFVNFHINIIESLSRVDSSFSFQNEVNLPKDVQIQFIIRAELEIDNIGLSAEQLSDLSSPRVEITDIDHIGFFE
jgi:hypothetical protein